MHTATPTRLQRSRKKGYRLPESAIYVGRPTMWGNPFMAKRWGHAKSVILHQRWIDGQIGALTFEKWGFCPGEIDAFERLRIRVLTSLHRIAGCDLACWCPLSSEWCHAETLLKMAPMHEQYHRFAA